MSTNFNKRIAVRVTNITGSPYLIKKHKQIVEFSVVTPEQSNHNKPVDMAIVSMIPQVDPDLIAYLNELLRSNKPEQQTQYIVFGSQYLKILESFRITPQYRQESSKN